jgi:hypothetical protein
VELNIKTGKASARRSFDRGVAADVFRKSDEE